MTFELTRDEDRTPEELAAMARSKAEQERKDARFGRVIFTVLGLVLLVIGFGVVSCVSSAGKAIKKDYDQFQAERVEQERRDLEASANAVPSDTLVIASAQQAVKGKMVDGQSARFRDVSVVVQSSGTKAVCGEVNSKNRAGGYAGYQHFISAGTDEHTYLEGQVPNFAEAWNQLCVR